MFIRQLVVVAVSRLPTTHQRVRAQALSFERFRRACYGVRGVAIRGFVSDYVRLQIKATYTT